MQSTAPDIDAYIAEAPEARRTALRKLRAACRKVLFDYEEGMDYGMRCFKRNGAVELAFASQKNTISLYVMKAEVIKKHKAALKGVNVGKACIKYTTPEKIDFAVVRGHACGHARRSPAALRVGRGVQSTR